MNGDTVIVNGCYAPHYHKSYKENCNIHPVFGFYTQLSTEEWWRTVFKGSLAHLGIPDKDLELAFHNVYHNFDYQLLPLADKLLRSSVRGGLGDVSPFPSGKQGALGDVAKRARCPQLCHLGTDNAAWAVIRRDR